MKKGLFIAMIMFVVFVVVSPGLSMSESLEAAKARIREQVKREFGVDEPRQTSPALLLPKAPAARDDMRKEVTKERVKDPRSGAIDIVEEMRIIIRRFASTVTDFVYDVSSNKVSPRTVLKLVLIGVGIGLIPALIARSKNRSFLIWWILGILIFVFALPAVLIVNRKEARKGKKKRDIVKENKQGPGIDNRVKDDKFTGEEKKTPVSVDDVSATEVYDKIERLSKLHDDGMLTDEEYDSKKKELLDRI